MRVGQKGLSTAAIVGIVVTVVVVVVAVAASAVILLKPGEGGATPTTTIMTPTTTTPTTTTTTTIPATTTTPTTTTTPGGGIGRVVSLTAEAVHETTYGGTMLKIVVEKEESYAPEYQELFRFVLQGPRGLIYDGENVYCWEENSWSYYHESTYLFEWVGNVGTFHIPMAGYHFNADGGTSIYDCWGNLVYENQYTFSGPKLEVLYEPTVYFSYATMVSYEPTLYERGVAGVTINIANTGDLPAYVHATRISVPGYGTTANSTFYLGGLVTYVVSWFVA